MHLSRRLVAVDALAQRGSICGLNGGRPIILLAVETVSCGRPFVRIQGPAHNLVLGRTLVLALSPDLVHRYRRNEER